MGVPRVVLLVVLGACSSPGEEGTVQLDYTEGTAFGRVGEELTLLVPASPGLGQTGSGLSVEPPLPPGLEIDPVTGVVSGSPEEVRATLTYRVRGLVDGDLAEGSFQLAVGEELPAAFGSLESGFSASVVAEDVQVPVKLALAPDGRLFYAELVTGRVQILSSDGQLQPSPFLAVSVETGGHHGLIGLAMHPDFETNGWLYVMFTEPGGTARVVRYTEDDGIGIDPVDILVGLPTGEINNGGELLFDASGHLLIAVGDNDDPALAQDEDSLAGKVLRVTDTGQIPGDSPDPDSPVWTIGLRNTFAMALHPETGGVFGVDNGPAADDELNFLVGERNFGWGFEGELGAEAGFTVRTWEDVITPTAVAFHDGSGGITSLAGELLLASYNAEDLRRIQLLGVGATDFHRELEFATFLPDGQDHKPLDLVVGEDGAIWVSTFTAIYRIEPFE